MLHLQWIDVEPASDNELFLPIANVEVVLIVLIGEIACMMPSKL